MSFLSLLGVALDPGAAGRVAEGVYASRLVVRPLEQVPVLKQASPQGETERKQPRMEAVELRWLTQKPSREPKASACVVYIRIFQCTHTPRAIRLLRGSMADFLSRGEPLGFSHLLLRSVCRASFWLRVCCFTHTWVEARGLSDGLCR